MQTRLLLNLLTLPCLMFLFCLDLAAQYSIDGLQGDVTQHEVDVFISNIQNVSIPLSEWNCFGNSNTHNCLADGTGGMDLEAINVMYEVAKDNPSLASEQTQLLKLAIEWTEAWLTHRNDLPLGDGRLMWTGNIEPVWPPQPPNSSGATYYESEVGDTIEHMGYTALNILQTPSIWSTTVPDGDPNGFGTTYLDRAITYVTMLDFSLDNAFTPWFIDPSTFLIHRPSLASGYLSSFHNVNAWNVQMMLIGAYWRLEHCHQILGDDPNRAAEYANIVQASSNLFVQNALSHTAPDGTPDYDWGYCNFGDCRNRTTGEDFGHGQYDIWGLTRSYSTGDVNATVSQMQTYAATLTHDLTLSIDPSTGAATYASHVDECCATNTYNYPLDAWLFLVPFDTSAYLPGANADIVSRRLAGSAMITAGVLWSKHWIFVHSMALPAGWSDIDIGGPGVAGSASFSSGTFTVNGGGSDIWGTSDNFHYAYEPVTGNLTITARVVSQQNTDLWAKAGVMMRESTAANAAFVDIFITPGHGVNLQYRPSTGVKAVQVKQLGGPVAPYWVRIQRLGTTFSAFASADGVNWTQLGQVSANLPMNALAGLSVTAHNNAALSTATFDTVNLQ